MVFEALVVDVLNRFLGEYVENLDTSQLKLGIWGGDVVLRDLVLKQRALTDFNLPLKISWGQLGKLVLKIPWKNLYGSPVIMDIQELFVMVAPNNEVKYDSDKEEKWNQEAKQIKLKQVEEAKKREVQTDVPDDTFMEKLAAQIIKNLEIKIQSIHIRYEDQMTNPGSPFSVGATMSNLSVLTSKIDAKSIFIHKVLSLEGLAIYWNSNSDLKSQSSPEQLVTFFRQNIPKADFKPEGYDYIFGPITAGAGLQMNPKPEIDGTNYTTPKIKVSVEMEEIGLALTRKQFRDILLFLENLHRMTIAAAYSKYRPFNVPVVGNTKEWWRFAYQAVSEDIKRRRLGWSWDHIKGHRQMCRYYAEAYRTKLTSKKCPPTLEKEITQLEKVLDVFNLVLLRERARVEAERFMIAEQENRAKSSWFSGWFSATSSQTESDKYRADIVKKLETAMTPTEKEKLYKAIDYQEGAVPTLYPKTFVETLVTFMLKRIVLKVRDDSFDPSPLILTAALYDVTSKFQQRPSASAVCLSMSLGNFTVLGMEKEQEKVPELVTSLTESTTLMDVLFETNPLDGRCDQRIHVNARPLKIIYHAETINRVSDIFTTQNSESINTIKSVTESLPTFQEMTSLGLQYAIEKRTKLDIAVNIQSSYVIVPYNGVYQPEKPMVIINFGELNVSTEASGGEVSVKKLHLKGAAEDEIFSTVLSQSYTKFKCQLAGMQILVRMPDENWEDALKETIVTPLHLLEPIDLTVVIKKSLVTDDPRIAKMVIEGNLPSITLNISEERLITLAGLASSIPTLEQESNLTTTLSASNWSLTSLGVQFENRLRAQRKQMVGKTENTDVEELVQGIDLVCQFKMNGLIVKISKTKTSPLLQAQGVWDKSLDVSEKFIELAVLNLQIDITYKTFDSEILVKLGGIELKQNHGNKEIPVVVTRDKKQDSYLFTLDFVTVDRKSPEFYTKNGAVANRLGLNMTQLSVVLHKEALLALMSFFNTLQEQIEEVKAASRKVDPEEVKRNKRLTSIFEEGPDLPVEKKPVPPKGTGKKIRRKKDRVEVIDFLLRLKVDEVDMMLKSDDQEIGQLAIQGVLAELSTRKSYTNVDCKLKKIIVLDLNPDTNHQKILTSTDEQTLSLQVTLYNNEFYVSSNSVDMSVVVELNRIRFVFLNRFLAASLDFANSFQTGTKMLKDASSVAAERAKKNVLKVYENATKMSLNVQITAPLVVFPQNSKSIEVILIDLGVLTLKNQLHELDTVVDSGRPLVDNMDFRLQNLKLSRAVLSETTLDPVYESALLGPITFQLVLKRNLSVSWFNALPDLEVVARLESIHLSVTHEDYSFALFALNENFSEGQAKNQTAELREAESTESRAAVAEAAGGALVKAEESDERQASAHTTIKFSFTMDSFVFDMATGGDRSLIDKTKMSERYPLARFVLETIALKGKMFSDGSSYTSVLLLNCVVEDTRTGKEGRLTRLMERKAETLNDTAGSESVKSMIDITFQQKGNDTFFDLRICQFDLILSMDFLMKVSSFFVVESPTVPTSGETKAVEIKPISSKHSKSSSKKAVKGKKDDGSRPGTFTVNIRLEKPDIIIVENMDSIDTEALVFHTELLLKYRTADSKQVLSGTLNDIGLFTCNFNPSKRSKTMSQVIRPFTISVAGSTPEGQGLHLDLCLTDIYIVVSPKTIELLSKCYFALYAAPTAGPETEEEINHSDIWELKKCDENDFWFLKTEEGEDALSAFEEENELSETVILEELCLVSMPRIVLTVEGSIAKSTTPMLLLEMRFQGQVHNWSHQLTVDSTLTVQMQYYNASLATWEPLIEPVEVLRDKKPVFNPWELSCHVVRAGEPDFDVSETDFNQIPAPNLSVTLSCIEKLELTITKTCMKVLSDLSEVFSSAVKQGTSAKRVEAAPFIIKNESGLLVQVILENSDLEVFKKDDKNYEIVQLEPGGEVELKAKRQEKRYTTSLAVFHKEEEKKESIVWVKLPQIDGHTLELCLTRSHKRYYPLSVVVPKTGRDVWGLVADVTILDSTNVLTLRSILQVKNHFQEPIDIHFMTAQGNEVEFVGTVEGQSNFNLPLYAVYNPTSELFFSVKGYSISIVPFIWKQLKNELNYSAQLQCMPKDTEDNDPFFIKVVGEVEQVYYENTYRHTMSSMCYNIHLQPNIAFLNALPVDLIVCPQGSAKQVSLRSGDKIHIPQAEPGVSSVAFRIEDYLEKEWSCKKEIPLNPPEFLVWPFESFDGLVPVTLNVGVHCSTSSTTLVLTIYCPFLMVNKTDYLLSYKFDDNSTVIYHPTSHKEPVMFSPSTKKFFSKKKASIKVAQGDWSDKFSLDVAGSGGTVECYDPKTSRTFMISVTIRLSFNSLTKIVLFTPYYVLLNKTHYTIQCQESDVTHAPWIEIEPGCCIPFWPRTENQRKRIRLKTSDSISESASFCYDSTDSCLLKLFNKYGGIFVDVHATNSGTYVTFNPYEPGQAPALIINHTDRIIDICEPGGGRLCLLKPDEMFMHAWINPSGERKLTWKDDKKKEISIALLQDELGEMVLQGDTLWYVSFLDGAQRILLFTDNQNIAITARASGQLEAPEMEVTFHLQGVGISVVNNENKTELLYMGFVSSGIAWEASKDSRHRYKPIPPRESYGIECAYQKYKDDCETQMSPDPIVVINNKMQIDFQNMEVLQPYKKKLRRTFEPGLWANYRSSQHQMSLHAKINRVQIDNQTHDCIFPVVLAPVAPPKTVAASQGPKPFFELSLLKVIAAHSRVQQYKYFKILVQEFSIKVDIGMVYHFSDFSSAKEVTDEATKANFKKDVQYTKEPLLSHVTVISSVEQKNFYDLLHLSPLKVHVSFSLAGNYKSENLPAALNVLLQSLGVTLTDLHDVVFKLSYFERKHAFLSNSQLSNEIYSHYWGQAVRQAYVLVLGLDVIGNPYGLVIGIGQGVEAFFYEPVQGIIQGPGEFATGVALGVKSLFGHTVGGTAGTLGKLTGTIGKGLAVLSMDKEYQKQRMEQQNRRPDNMAASMAQGGKGLVMGVFEGVTGVVMKPVTGAKEEGVGGFFKGMGKGVMGLVTRPMTGVVDFASTSLNAVKRATENGGEAKRLRSPRFFQDDKVVLPYRRHEAQGNCILYEIDKKKYASTDKYEYHARLRGKEIILLTDKRMIIAELSDVFGTWQEHLMITWLDMGGPPQPHHKGVVIQMPRKKGGMFAQKHEIKFLLVDDPDIKETLTKKMTDLYSLEKSPQ